MKVRMLLISLLVLAGLGCNSTMPAPVATGSSPRKYNGSASVGGFLSITLDPAALTLSYKNLSNGDTGVVPYTVNGDGTYALKDPKHNLLAAYEVPNYALLVQAAKAGPNHDTLALITAVQESTISKATWAGRDYNYMQFRTSSGGMEVGSVSLDAQANVSLTSYSPYESTGLGNPFHAGGFPGSSFQADPSGSFLKMIENGGTSDYVFGTANGIFAVDNSNGTILGLKKAATKDFDPSFAGTYKVIYYEKTGAQTGQGNVETGTPSVGNATMVIGSAGQVTVQDSTGTTLVQATLTPVADPPYLYGTGELQDPCFGLFTFRVTTANTQQDLFVSFMSGAILFSSFKGTLPWVTATPMTTCTGSDLSDGVGRRAGLNRRSGGREAPILSCLLLRGGSRRVSICLLLRRSPLQFFQFLEVLRRAVCLPEPG
jgi:hypothetical protein